MRIAAISCAESTRELQTSEGILATMTSTNLLHNAYLHIDAGDLRSALGILEYLVNDDSGNVEAWEAYMQICETCDELDRLCERVLQIEGIQQIDRGSILDYYYFLRQKIRSSALESELQKRVILELVDQFNLTIKDHLSAQPGWHDRIIGSFTWVLGKAILVPYIVLLGMGLSLLYTGNAFGYWTLAMLVLNGMVNTWKVDLFISTIDRMPSRQRLDYSFMQSDEITCPAEMIH